MNKLIFVYRIIAFCYILTGCQHSAVPVYKDPQASVNARVKDLVGRMTLEEKVAQMVEATCSDIKEDNLVKTVEFSYEKFRNGIGVIDGFTLTAKEFAGAVNRIQDYLVNKTRLGIPAIFLSECLHGLVQDGATIYPQSIAMASTCDTSLIWEAGCHKK